MDALSSILSNAAVELVGINAVIFALAAIGLNIHFGYTGLLNFGQAAFAAVGAYGIALTVLTFGLPFGVGIVVGLAAGITLALLLGIPTLRLRADYLAIATIAVAEIIRLVFRSNTFGDFFGGADGIQGFARGFDALNPIPDRREDYGFGPWQYNNQELWELLVGWSLVLLACLLVFLLMRSPWGRVVKAIREDEDAVRSLGKNVFGYKQQALVLGGVMGCLAGFMFGLSRGSVLPDNYAPQFTFLAYAALLIGGAARVFGPVLGSAILWLTLSLTDGVLRTLVGLEYPEWLNFDAWPSWLLLSGTDVGAVRFMLVGLILILLMAFRPQGILGDRKELALDVR